VNQDHIDSNFVDVLQQISQSRKIAAFQWIQGVRVVMHELSVQPHPHLAATLGRHLASLNCLG